MRKLVVSVLLLLCATVSATAAPNIVVILTDDQEDTGSMAYMRKLHSLAERGITFTNSFVNFSLCAPSRSSFLTGEAAHNQGIRSNKAQWAAGPPLGRKKRMIWRCGSRRQAIRLR
jgi:arylsulfatase A-like enzyme